jgi:hypothetical protein
VKRPELPARWYVSLWGDEACALIYASASFFAVFPRSVLSVLMVYGGHTIGDMFATPGFGGLGAW